MHSSPRRWVAPSRRASLFASLWLCCIALPVCAASPVARHAGGWNEAAVADAIAAERQRPMARTHPRADFLAEPAIRSVALSADGRVLAWLRERGRKRELWVAPVEALSANGAVGAAHARRLLAHTEAERVLWLADRRHLLLESPRQLWALDAIGRNGMRLLSELGERERRELRAIDSAARASVVIGERLDAPRRYRLLRIGLDGRSRVLYESGDDVLGFALDPQGRVAFVSHAREEQHVVFRVDRAGGLRDVLRCRQLQRCGPLSTTPDGRSLWLLGDVGGDLRGLQRLDPDGRLLTVHSDPRGIADIDEAALDPVDEQPLFALYDSVDASIAATDPSLREPVEALARRFQGRRIDLSIGRGTDARWLVRESGSQLQAPRWHLYDPRSGRVDEILRDDSAPRIGEAELARKIAFSYRASDGFLLRGFVSLPPGADPARTPLIASIHGGPWNHERSGYDAHTQFLVNRGYAVFEPNFRGSTGHGRAYQFAPQGDYGNGRVQRDIVDGVRYLLGRGIGDAGRVGIVGASFGGYSALLGATFEPDLFKVAVAAVPCVDFGRNARDIALHPELGLMSGIPLRTSLRLLRIDIEDPATMRRLHAQSPLANLARLRRPVLLLAGARDQKVTLRSVTDYAARLRLAGRDVGLLVDPDAGHSTRAPIAREAQMYLSERLLRARLGGVSAAPPSAALRDYLQRNLRLANGDLRDLRPRSAADPDRIATSSR